MTDMTVLDRQIARQRWLPQQQSSFSFFNGALDDCMVTHLDNPATGFQAIEALGWPDLTAAAPGGSSLPAPGVSGADSAASAPKEAAGVGRSKKRKADDARAQEKRAEAKMEMSSDGSGEVSKAPPPPKQDYIHVRARRGQATDSHSLAERVRREKISERMKYLQELVPGCSKITGKAGMLDEIINYVQSLQKQVEFLSMKLATVNPRIDINIDQFFSKEIAQASNASFQMVGISPEVGESPYLHFNPLQQAFAYYGLDMAMNAPELAPRRTASATMSDTTFNSCPNANSSSFAWENLLQSGYNAEIEHGLRGFVFPFQSLQGNVVCNNPKMEL